MLKTVIKLLPLGLGGGGGGGGRVSRPLYQFNIQRFVIPYFPQDTAYYMHHMSMLVASYGLVLVGNYLVGSILLVIVYWKTLKLIQRMKKSYSELET